VQTSKDQQRQQDTHEFLSQLLHHFGSMRSGEGDSASQGDHAGPPTAAGIEDLEKLESEFSQACAKFRRCKSAADPRDTDTAKHFIWNVAYEYVQQQWESSLTRMNAEFGLLFEGQRLATVHCTHCERTGLSGAEPFSVEEVQLAAHAQDEGFLSRVSSLFTAADTKFGLADLLKQGAESPAPEGYRCPNARCGKIGCSVRKTQYVRLPATLVFHVNRAQPDGSRCSKVLDFEPTMDLREYNLVTHFGRPMNYSWTPCSTKYTLFGAVFHKGHSAHSGHYLAFVEINGAWVIVNDHKVTRATDASRTPMAFEANQPEDGARVALLFYRRDELSS
jgi:ubiquitin C-terminal hydrolase